MTFDLIAGLHMQIQTWHPPLRLCIHAKYYVKSGLTNVLKNANKTKNMHFFFKSDCQLNTNISELYRTTKLCKTKSKMTYPMISFLILAVNKARAFI